MAAQLNKNRMFYTRILTGLTLAFGILGTSRFPSDSPPHEAMRFFGYALLAFCAMGRLYSTAFIGGIKNKSLVTIGPYSVVRNPLYFFSLCGAAGLGLATGSITMTAIIFFGFLIVYIGLISREEGFLLDKFGKEFTNYKRKTPKLMPDFSCWHCPAELTFQPKFLNFAWRDAVWWFAPLPAFEVAQLLQEKGVFHPLIELF
jgi:protein-S-isoprenylcysteine O-methyltransferase Ste14